MPYEPDNHHINKTRELDFLVHALGIDELYRRVHALDGEGDLPEAGEFNPTGDPMVQRTYQGELGSLSGGPREENEQDLSVIDPEHVAKIERLAEIHEAEAAERAEAAKEEKEDSDKDEKKEEKKEPDKEPAKESPKVSTPASRSAAAKK